jgi:hypothetical protein
MRALVMIGVVVALASAARAQPAPTATQVALLPLDADAKLEIYGQPVASEVARVLSAGGLDVVIVGPKMAVPARARLVLDGTIKAGKGGAVVMSMRIRDPHDTNRVLDTLPATAASLDGMDPAIDVLSNLVLASIKGSLPKLLAQDAEKAKAIVEHHALPVKPVLVDNSPMLAAVSINEHAEGNIQPFEGALKSAVAPWALHRHHAVKMLEMKELGGKAVPKTAAAANADVAVWLEIREVKLELGVIPMGRARVRVQISDPSRVLFDRIVFTDTVVGDKNMTPQQLAERVAREVLAIAEPHMHQVIPRWQ